LLELQVPTNVFEFVLDGIPVAAWAGPTQDIAENAITDAMDDETMAWFIFSSVGV
jgi:hypothetical protein